MSKVDWEAISVDKHRSNYLGNSIKGAPSRSCPNPLWYTKQEEVADDEEVKLKIKLQDELAMMAALGLKVPEIKHEAKKLEVTDLSTIVGRGQELESDLQGERVMGAGKGPSRQLDVVTEKLVSEPTKTGPVPKERRNVIYLKPSPIPGVVSNTSPSNSSEKERPHHHHHHRHGQGHHHRHHSDRSRSRSRS
ncbi:hypothetical protein WA171_006811 [Blastocystis sp. BT1]